MGTYTFRVVVDAEEDCFRDVEIAQDDTFESLHSAIVEAFKFRGDQMASFYMSNNEWEKGEEIALMDMGMGRAMNETLLNEMVKQPNQKILYVYDFLKMWIFYVELIKINEGSATTDLPFILLAIGTPPNEDDKEMPDLLEGVDLSSGVDGFKDWDDDLDDFDDDFGGFENIDDLDI